MSVSYLFTLGKCSIILIKKHKSDLSLLAIAQRQVYDFLPVEKVTKIKILSFCYFWPVKIKFLRSLLLWNLDDKFSDFWLYWLDLISGRYENQIQARAFRNSQGQNDSPKSIRATFDRHFMVWRLWSEKAPRTFYYMWPI